MDYKTLYEIDLGNYQLVMVIIPITFLFLGVFTARQIKKYGFSPPFGFLKLHSQGFINNYTRFFSIMVAFFGFIILIVFFIKIPISIMDKKEIKDALENGNVMVVNGKVIEFMPAKNINVDSESFRINDVKFEYSEYEDIYGYHTTSKHNKIIKENGQDLRITYYRLKGKIIILKIEEPINY